MTDEPNPQPSDRDLILDPDQIAKLESEVEQLRTLVQSLKFHTDENAQLRRVCVDQAEQIADLRAALSVGDRPRAVPPRHRWRTEPPTPDEVTELQWWWNKPTDGVPHILQLDRDPSSGLIFDAGESTTGACPPPFDPSDWPGEWAPCMTPDDVTARVSRIAEAGKRLVMSHVGKVKELRAQLALETAALELACAADVHAPVTIAEARRRILSLIESYGSARCQEDLAGQRNSMAAVARHHAAGKKAWDKIGEELDELLAAADGRAAAQAEIECLTVLINTPRTDEAEPA